MWLQYCDSIILNQWHLVETNCNNIFTTRNSWNISRSSKFCISHFITTFASETMDGWMESPGIYSLPSSSAFSKLIRKSLITRARGAAPGLSWHHVIMSHDIITLMTSCHMTCHHHSPPSHHNHHMTSADHPSYPCEQAKMCRVYRKSFM